jgi:DNA-binding SARP family transcriptional activator/predicted ATPase
VHFRTRKTLALLSFLALEGGMQPRARLTALLWPELEETQARGNLRNLLMYLREALGSDQSLIVNRQAVGLSLDQAQFDVRDLEQALRAEHATLEALEAVAQFHRGELLEAFTLPDAPEFEDWLAAQREVVRGWFDGLLERLLGMYIAQNDTERALETARRRLRLEPLNERAHRQLIGLHQRAGNRAAALEAYRQCRLILQRELGVEPSPATRAMIETAPQTTTEPAPQSIPSQKPTPIRQHRHDESVFVGRHAELERMRAATTARKVIFLSGESGIGKSRLLSEFANARGSWVTLRGRPTDAGLPFSVVARAVRSVSQAHPAEIERLPHWVRRELSRLVPELENDPAPPITSEDERLRLFDAFVSWGLGVFAQDATIVLDDLHFWDVPSFDIGAYAAVRGLEQRGGGLMVIGAFRRGELSADIERRIRIQVDSGRAELIELEPLGTSGVRDLILHTIKTPLETERLDTVARALQRVTGGNPLFVLEALRSKNDTDWASNQLETLTSTRTPRVKGLIDARLERLPKTARDLARVAAVAGSAFSLTLAARVLEAHPLSLSDTFETLEHAGVMRGEQFSHDLLCDAVLESIPPAAKVVLHARVLEALEGTSVPAATLARHAAGAAMPAAIVLHSLAAGDEAFRLYAMAEAVEHYERAQATLISHRQLLDRLAPEDRQRLYANLGYALDYLGESERANHAYERLLAYGEERSDPRVLATAYNRLANHATSIEVNLEKAAALYHRALEAATQSTDPAAVIETRISLAWLENQRWRLSDALEHTTEALGQAQAAQHAPFSLEALEASFNIELNLGRWVDSREHAQQALALARATGARISEAHALAMMGYCSVFLGEPELGIKQAGDALEISMQIGWLAGQGFSERVLALCLLELGALQDAFETAQRGLRTARTRKSPLAIVYALIALGRCQTALGFLSQASQCFIEAHALSQDNASRIPQSTLLKAYLDGHLCAIRVLEADWDTAASLALRSLESRDAPSLSWFNLTPRHFEYAALGRIGRFDLVRADLEAFKTAANTNPRSRIWLAQATASLAVLENNPEHAIECLEEARTSCLKLGLVTERWQIAVSLTRLFDQLGRSDAAREAQRAALETAQSLAAHLTDPELRTTFLAFAESLIGLPIKTVVS